MPTSLSDLRAMRAQLRKAGSIEQLDALYEKWVGYSRVEDDPDVTLDVLADDLVGYLTEVCVDVGIDFDDVSE